MKLWSEQLNLDELGLWENRFDWNVVSLCVSHWSMCAFLQGNEGTTVNRNFTSHMHIIMYVCVCVLGRLEMQVTSRAHPMSRSMEPCQGLSECKHSARKIRLICMCTPAKSFGKQAQSNKSNSPTAVLAVLPGGCQSSYQITDVPTIVGYIS